MIRLLAPWVASSVVVSIFVGTFLHVGSGDKPREKR